MIRSFRLLAASVALACLTTPATVAAQSTYFSFDDFIAAIGPSGIDGYDDLAPDFVPGPIARSAGAYSYSVGSSAGVPFNNLFAFEGAGTTGDIWLSLEEAVASLSFDGFGPDVFAIGGRFFATDFDGVFSSTTVRVQGFDVMGNSIEALLSPASADAFFGMRFDYALASLTLTAENGQGPDFFFATANDLVLGEAPRSVPEPQAAWLLVAGMGVLFMARRRQRA